jgi:hypothetical protein
MGTPPHPATVAGHPSSATQTILPAVGFTLKDIPPTQPIYLQKNDQLVLQTLSNSNNFPFAVSWRILQPNGEITEGVFNGTAQSSPSSFVLGAFEGWLLSLSAAANGAQPAGTWCFLQVFIGRNPAGGSSPQVYGNIWEGYIFHIAATGWPGSVAQRITDGAGTIRSITGSTPAAGADISETVPANRRWTLLSIRAQLTTTATVANRMVAYRATDGVNTLWFSFNSVAQAASLINTYTGFPGATFFNDASGHFILPFPQPFVLKGGFVISTNTIALQAADQWTAPQYEVIEWGNWDT